MHEITLLESLWPKDENRKNTRSTTLIVPEISYNRSEGFLENEHWYFNVPYAFRDALDIKFEERKKDKKPYMVWTQGPILNFKEGDCFSSKNGKAVLQIRFANPMGWDQSKKIMYEGSVSYDMYSTQDTSSFFKVGDDTCSQMDFLKLLITGVRNN